MGKATEPDFADWSREVDMQFQSDRDYAQRQSITLSDGIFRIGGTTIGSTAVGAAIGSALGPSGVLLGAVVGATCGIALSTYDILRRNAQ